MIRWCIISFIFIPLISQAQDFSSSPPFNGLQYTGVGDGIRDNTTAIIQTLDTGRTILFPPGIYRIASNLTIPRSAHLIFLKGAMLAPDSDAILTSECTIQAPRSHIFSGQGNVTFGPGSVLEVYPEWWGANPDGITDCSEGFQKAFKTGMPVPLASGTYRITSSIIVPKGLRIAIRGTGQQHKSYKRVGGAVLLLDSTEASTLIDMSGGDHAFTIDGIVFTTTDLQGDLPHNGIIVGDINTRFSQTSKDAPFRISGCVFQNFGGIALSLGGEVYGRVESSVFHNLGQAIHIKEQGEVTIVGIHFEKMIKHKAGKIPGDAMIHVVRTVVKIVENVFAYSEDFQHVIHYHSATSSVISENKMERSGARKLDHHFIYFSYDEKLISYGHNIRHNSMTASSISTEDMEGRFIVFETNEFGRFQSVVIDANIFTYSPKTPASVPVIDFSKAHATGIHIGQNYWERGETPFIKLPPTSIYGSPFSEFTFAKGDRMIFQPVSFRIEKKRRKEPTLQSLGVVARGHTYGQVIPIALFYEGSKAIDDEIIVIIDGYTTDQPLVIPPGQKTASIVFQNSPMLIKKIDEATGP